MKRFFKVFANAVVAVMLCCFAAGFAACEKTNTMVVRFSAGDGEYSLTLKLYPNLAENTVNKIMKYAKDGLYDDAIFYTMEGYGSQIMVGDLKADGQEVVFNDVFPEITGEYEYAGHTGSDLKNKKGSVGLWRSWFANGSYSTSSSASETGRGTWYLPTSDISSYNGYFCVFATYDTSDSANNEAITALTTLFSSSESYEYYRVYYTGTYDEAKTDENYGLTFHCVKESAYNEDSITDLFEASDDADKSQLVRYNSTRVKLPVELSAKIISVTVK